MLIRTDQFVHRQNRDNTIDSICRSCFATVATAMWEADLDAAEIDHSCDRMMLERLRPKKGDGHVNRPNA